MLLTIKFLLWIVTLTISMNILVLFIECLAALFSRPIDEQRQSLDSGNFRILIPAHNEEACIEQTLTRLLTQVNQPEQIVVIADNCTDQTAEIAGKFQVTILVRENESERGKGYALAYGLDYLASNPPEIVIFIDADCLVEEKALEILVNKVMATGKAVQALYLMEKPENPSPKDAISAFAVLVKNWVRPLGLSYLRLPCLLTGTGMAFPWSVISQASLADANIVEDMQLGLNLAIAGYPPVFCPEARVSGILPQKEQVAKKQRTRWEHGHLQTIITQVPRLFKAALWQKSFQLLGLALELSIPPLSLLVMLWALGMTISLITSFLLGFWLPTLILSISGALMFFAIIIAWAKFGKGEISLTTLMGIPFYILSKVTVYLAFVVKRQSKWVKTEREQLSGKKVLDKYDSKKGLSG